MLLFLLMLAFLALAQEWKAEADLPVTEPQRELKETKVKLEAAKSVLNNVRKVVEEYKGSIPVPDEPVTLERVRSKETRDSRNLTDGSAHSLLEDLRELLERARDSMQRTQKQANEANALAQRAKKELLVLREKGHNPPCWYERVSDGRGGDREKPYYTFEVAVFDDSMILRRVQVPPGGARDDRDSIYSSYSEEAEILQFDQLPYNIPLDDAAISTALRPIYDAGKEGEVRSYSCIFWARVWDKTSPGAKERWKSAHDGILESLLGTYTVSDDTWEDGGTMTRTTPSTAAVPYDRTLYGGWIDQDGDCQNTRHEVLIAESTESVTLDSSGCKVISGRWEDPYTGQVFTDPRLLDIDHFIPLAEVHRSGGHSWTPSKRQQYANDLSNPATLISVSASANRSKGARDPAQWLPPNRSYHCEYLETWVYLKTHWKLSMDPAEKEFLTTSNCLASQRSSRRIDTAHTFPAGRSKKTHRQQTTYTDVGRGGLASVN